MGAKTPSARGIIAKHAQSLGRQGGRVVSLKAMLEQYYRVDGRCRRNPAYADRMFALATQGVFRLRFGEPGAIPRTDWIGPDMPAGISR